MATWTITASEVNDDGTRIILFVTVTGLGWLPVENESDKGDKTKIGRIEGWRFNASNLSMFKRTAGTGADGDVTSVEVYFIQGSSSECTFRVAIRLADAARIAINANAGSPTPKVSRLIEGWITLKAPGQSAAGPLMEHASHANLAFDASKVGRLPATSMVLHASAHAEWVALDGVSGSMTSWSDLSGSGNALTGKPTAAKPTLATGPVVQFNGASDPARFELASPPLLQDNCAMAVSFAPSIPEGPFGTLVGRYNYDAGGGVVSWRLLYSSIHSAPFYHEFFAYECMDTSGDPWSTSHTLTTQTAPSRRLLVYNRGGSPADDPSECTMWVQGSRIVQSTIPSEIEAGTGPLSVAARRVAVSPETWDDAFKHQMYDLALYSNVVTADQAALIHHHLATRAGIELAHPVAANLTQAFGPSNPVPQRRLDRKPIGVINLFGGDHNGGDARSRTGQTASWRGSDAASIQSYLEGEIRSILTACDDFEIMFNRPGGTLAEDIVPSDIFGFVNGFSGESIVTTAMRSAMVNAWNTFGLRDYNNRGRTPYHVRPYPSEPFYRRAWFYTGAGLALDHNAQPVTDGRMFSRVVAPATGRGYAQHPLKKWTDEWDGRFKCFFCDAAVHIYAKFVEIQHEQFAPNVNYELRRSCTLVGEAIPYDENALKGAAWYASMQNSNAVWWNISPTEARPSKSYGFNWAWASDPATRVIYFGVENNDYLRLEVPASTPVAPSWIGSGSNLRLGEVYRMIRRGATPIARRGTYKKVGAAWNLAMGRMPLNRWDRTGRASRVKI